MRGLPWAAAGRILRAAAQPALFALAVGTFFAVLAPFATHRLGWPLVWVFWTGLMLAATAIAEGTVWLLARFAPRLRGAAWVAAVAVAVALPVSGLLALVEWAGGGAIRFDPWPMTFLYALVVSLGMTVLGVLVDRAAAPPPAAGPAPGPPPFLARIPARLSGAELYAVSAEDHYLRIHTSRGHDLVLMRLSDALRELAGADGLHVHRSWWVARGGVEKVLRTDGRLVLLLRNGAEVPVARTRAKAVRAAGWL